MTADVAWSPVDIARWAILAFWNFVILDMWENLPGPWYVKVVIIAVCVAIPGPQDEIAIVLISKAWKRYRVRRANRVAPNMRDAYDPYGPNGTQL